MGIEVLFEPVCKMPNSEKTEAKWNKPNQQYAKLRRSALPSSWEGFLSRRQLAFDPLRFDVGGEVLNCQRLASIHLPSSGQAGAEYFKTEAQACLAPGAVG